MKTVKRHFKTILFALICGVLTTSCIELTEKIKFNKNGSGSAEIIMDLSKFKETIKMLEGMGGDEAEDGEKKDYDAEMKETVNEGIAKYEAIEGISKVKGDITEDWVITYNFKFADVDALNKALESHDAGDDDSPTGGMIDGSIHKDKFRWDKKSLTIVYPEIEKDEEETSSEDSQMAKSMFEGSFFTMEYTFKKKVKNVMNKNSEISDNGKVVTQKIPMADLIETDGLQQLNNKIIFK